MDATARNLMDADAFLVWCLDREARYELVEGVPIEMMTGASSRHDRIVVNILAALHGQLRGTGCTPATADIAVRTRRRTLRRPDITVTCDPPRPDVYDADKVRMVVEVLSLSNRGIGWERKLNEYRAREGMDYILLVESAAPAATLLARSAGTRTWEAIDADGLEAALEMPAIGCQLVMADVYDGVAFDAADEAS